MLGWSQLEKTTRSGVWLFRGARQGRVFSLPFSQRETGSGRGRTTQRGRSFSVLRVLVRMRMGKA